MLRATGHARMVTPTGLCRLNINNTPVGPRVTATTRRFGITFTATTGNALTVAWFLGARKAKRRERRAEPSNLTGDARERIERAGYSRLYLST